MPPRAQTMLRHPAPQRLRLQVLWIQMLRVVRLWIRLNRRPQRMRGRMEAPERLREQLRARGEPWLRVRKVRLRIARRNNRDVLPRFIAPAKAMEVTLPSQIRQDDMN